MPTEFGDPILKTTDFGDVVQEDFTPSSSEKFFNKVREFEGKEQTYKSFPGKMQAATILKGTLTGATSFLDTLNDIGLGLRHLMTDKPDEDFDPTSIQIASEFLTKKAAYWEDILQKEGASGIDRLIGSVVGGFAPSVVEWSAGVPFAALKGGAEAAKEDRNILYGATVGGIKRYVLGKLLNYYSMIKDPVIRRGLAAGTLGGTAAIEGATPEDIATQAILGGALASRQEKIQPTTKAKPAMKIIQEARKEKLLGAIEDRIATKVSEQIENLKLLNKNVSDPARKELHKQQAAAYDDILEKEIAKGTPPEDAQMKATAGFKKYANIPDVTPPELLPQEWEFLFNKNAEVHTGDSFAINNTREALQDWRSGTILRDFQFKFLADVIGKKSANELYFKQKDIKGFTGWDVLKTSVQAAKLPFSLDVQFFRQASSFVARHPIIYTKGGWKAVRAYVSEKYAEGIQKQLLKDPYHQDAKGRINFLSESPWSTVAGAELAPEQFAQGRPILQKLLKAGLKSEGIKKKLATPIRGLGHWILGSERSMVTSVNYAMNELYKIKIKYWEKKGKIATQEQIEELQKKVANGDVVSQELLAKTELWKNNYADTINTFMKILRARSPTGKEIQRAANYILFSPSMTASRVKRPWVLLTNEGSRAEIASLLATEIGKLFLLSFITKVTGEWLASKYDWAKKSDGTPKITSDLNLLSSDWGSVKIDNAHYDFGGGDKQFYRTLARFATGHTKNQAGIVKEIPRMDVLEQYAKSRETALLGVMTEMFTGRNFQGEKIFEIPDWETFAKEHKGPLAPYVAKMGDSLTQTKLDKATYLAVSEVARSVAPQFLQSFFQAAIDEGWTTAVGAGAAEMASANVQTYPDSSYTQLQKAENKYSQIEYQKDWDDIGPRFQAILRRKYPEIEDWEQQAKVERSERELELTLRPRQLDLPNSTEKLLKKLGVPKPSISRNIGTKFYLNDKNFKRYNELASNLISDRFELITSSPNWLDISAEKKQERIQLEIDNAKSTARKLLIQEVNLQTAESLQ